MQVGLDRDTRFKQGRFQCLVACEPGGQRPPQPGSSAGHPPGADVPPLFRWLVQRDLQVALSLSAEQGLGPACSAPVSRDTGISKGWGCLPDEDSAGPVAAPGAHRAQLARRSPQWLAQRDRMQCLG